jgi:two-component system nitrate/nitrite response regulator NarL
MQYAHRPVEDTIHVLVADDTLIHTQLLADALKRDRGLEVISSPSYSRDLIAAANLRKFDVVVISSNLDDEPLRGFDVLRELRASRPDLRAIMLLESSKREAILQAFRAGAKGIFSRHESVDILCKCVRRVHEGHIWANAQQMSYAVEALSSAPTVRAVDANGLNLLSKREADVVQCLAEGLTNREIAERLGLSQHTIKNYLFRVFDKLGVSSRIELLFMTLSQAGAPQLTAQVSSGDPTNGNGNGKPEEATLAWCQKAAEQGLPAAQIALAQRYWHGNGVAKDMVSAYMWYLVSERTSLNLKDEIQAAKQKIEDQLGTEQMVEAEKKAAEWLKKSKEPSSSSVSPASLRATRQFA